MQGSKEDPGIMHRSFIEIFRLLGSLKNQSTISISLYVVEVYMDNLIDLLGGKENKNAHLEIKEDYRGMTYIQNITLINIQTLDDIEKYVKIAMSNRKTGKTDMNEESSRSHLIISLIVDITNKEKNSVI